MSPITTSQWKGKESTFFPFLKKNVLSPCSSALQKHSPALLRVAATIGLASEVLQWLPPRWGRLSLWFMIRCLCPSLFHYNQQLVTVNGWTKLKWLTVAVVESSAIGRVSNLNWTEQNATGEILKHQIICCPGGAWQHSYRETREVVQRACGGNPGPPPHFFGLSLSRGSNLRYKDCLRSADSLNFKKKKVQYLNK